MDITLLIPIIIFVGMLFLIVIIFFSIKASRERRELIKRIKPEKVGFGSEKSKNTGFFTEIASLIGNIVKPRQKKDISDTQKNLTSLGYRSKRATTTFFGIQFLLIILLPIVFLFLKLFIFKKIVINSTSLMLIPVVLAMAGYYLPRLWLQVKIKKRKKKILESLPDTLDLLVICTEAGMGMDAAINRVAEEMKLKGEAMSKELRLYNLEVGIGKPRVDALKSLASRIDLEDMKNLVTLLIQTDRFGTSIASALRVHSDFMRVQRTQRAEEAAAKLSVKLLIPLIFFIFPALITIIMGPAMIQIYRTILRP